MNLITLPTHLTDRLIQFSDFIPIALPNGLEGDNPDTRTNFVTGLISNAIILIFVLIIIAGIIYAAWSGLKYIQSQGAADKVEEAQNAIKQVLIGVIVAFVGVILVVVIQASFFSDGSVINQALTCVFSGLTDCG